MHVYATTAISVFLASFYLKLWALFFLFYFFYLNFNLLLYFSFITCLLVLFFVIFECNFKRVIAFGSIFHCWVSLLFIYLSYIFQFKQLLVLFFIVHFIHAFCSGLFFYIFGILYEFFYIKTWIVFTSFSKFWNQFIFLIFLLTIVYFSFPLFFTFLIELVILNNINSQFFFLLYSLLIFTNFIFLFLNFKFFYNSFSLISLNYFISFKNCFTVCLTFILLMIFHNCF